MALRNQRVNVSDESIQELRNEWINMINESIQELTNYKNFLTNKETKLEPKVKTWFLTVINDQIDCNKKIVDAHSVQHFIRKVSETETTSASLSTKLEIFKKFFTDNKKVLFQGNMFQTYSDMILDLQKFANKLKSLMAEQDQAYEKSSSVSKTLTSLQTQLDNIMKMLTEQFKDNQLAWSFTIPTKDPKHDLSLRLIIAGQNRSYRELVTALLKVDESGLTPHEVAAKDIAKDKSKNEGNINDVEIAFKAYENLKAVRDAAIAKQQLGLHKPAGLQQPLAPSIVPQQKTKLKA